MHDARRRVGGQAGVGLIETLLAIVIIGVMGAFAIVSLLLSIRTSKDVGFEQRQVAALEGWSATLGALPYSGGVGQSDACATEATLRTTYQTAGRAAATATGGFLGVANSFDAITSDSLEVTDVKRWNPQAKVFDTLTVANRGLGCSTSASATQMQRDQGMQQLTIRVTLNGSSRTMQIIKRRP